MDPLLAHGSGVDEIVAFLALAALVLLYQGGKRLLHAVRREPAEADQPVDRDSATGA